MRITIDTKEDSPEDIHKVIELLSKLNGNRHVSQRNIFEDSASAGSAGSSSAQGGVFNMFNNEPSSPSPSSSDNDNSQLGETLKSLASEKKEEEPKVQIIAY